MKTRFDPGETKTYHLPALDSWPPAGHRFDAASIWAVRAALAARRPLLVRGEPGLGKSQLARAAAHFLGVPFLSQVINARSEPNDLLYSYDAVSRLAQAQLMSARKEAAGWENTLEEKLFVRPGILWWAFDWKSAETQASQFCRKIGPPARLPPNWKPGRGCVVLIDEIDKADSDLPNSLLESLGNNGFQADPAGCSVALPAGAKPPLVVITTNEERELPMAFLRRCLALQMRFPETEEKQVTFLLDRARVHFSAKVIGEKVCRAAAEQLLADRQNTPAGQARPGAAEYLDILRALVDLGRGNDVKQLEALKQIREFATRKNAPEGTY